MGIAVVEMTPAERWVLWLRYGLSDGKSRTLSAVGGASGHSREWARQVESKAMRRLLILGRAYLAGAVLSRSQQADLVAFYPAWVAWTMSHARSGDGALEIPAVPPSLAGANGPG